MTLIAEDQPIGGRQPHVEFRRGECDLGRERAGDVATRAGPYSTVPDPERDEKEEHEPGEAVPDNEVQVAWHDRRPCQLAWQAAMTEPWYDWLLLSFVCGNPHAQTG